MRDVLPAVAKVGLKVHQRCTSGVRGRCARLRAREPHSVCRPLVAGLTCGVQATHTGFGFISQDNVFKVCDQPHPLLVATIIRHCQ